MIHKKPRYYPVAKRISRVASGVVLSAALSAAFAGMAYANPANSADSREGNPAASSSIVGYAKGRLLAAPRAGVSNAEIEKALRGHRARPGKKLRGNIHVIELPPGANEIAVMNALKRDKRFKFVELDMQVALATTNDPDYSNSWALPKINAPQAWGVTSGNGITIAILDTGVNSTHLDLAPNMVSGWNMFDNNSDTSDVHGHGTSVAGAAAMAGNNGVGSAGVAHSARIMPVRISGLDGYAYFSTIANGVYWAADNGAKVANISYGVSGSATVQSAAAYMRSKGGVVVVAAGNTGSVDNTMASDTMLSISASNQNDGMASFSTYGPFIDVAAPGVNIYAPKRGGGYGYVGGTSFSSPIVAGTVALVMAANSKLTPADVDRIITSSAVDLGTPGFDQFYGHGRVDAGRAVEMARSAAFEAPSDTEAPIIGITSPTGGTVSGLVPVDIRYFDNVGVTRAELYVNGTRVATDITAPFSFVWDTAGNRDGGYQLVARAYDAAGNVGTSPAISVTLANATVVDPTPVEDRVAPVISSFNLRDGMKLANKQKINAAATDNIAVTRMSLSINGSVVATSTSGSINYTWNTLKVSRGSYTITVSAWDAAGNTASQSVTAMK